MVATIERVETVDVTVPLDKKDIQARVEDWQHRIAAAYEFFKDALGGLEGICFLEDQKKRMHEELMRCHCVDPVNLPVLDIRKNDQLIASLQPVGLWVVGANGRIDILTKSGAYLLVDKAEKFEEPDWYVYPPSKRDPQKLDANLVRELCGFDE